MSSSAARFIALVRKDLVLESRAGETLASVLFLGLLLSVVVSFGVGSAFLDPAAIEKLFPALVWMVFVLAAAASIGRSAEYDQEHRAFEALVLSGTPLAFAFLAKCASSFVVLAIGHVAATAALAVLLNVEVAPFLGAFAVVSSLVLAGYAALSTVVVGCAGMSRTRGVLVPLLLLPLVFPLFFCAVELTFAAASGTPNGFDSPWFTLLVVLDLGYLLCGSYLYEFIVRD